MERNGITPACAGKSNQITPVSRRGEDHPRVCGEKRQIWYKMLCCGGSPPRVRGKVLLHRHFHDKLGITPACAGKRPTVKNIFLLCGDHPRVCGEKLCHISHHIAPKGSPPRVRGKVETALGIFLSIRITPACAGKRTGVKSADCVRWDHPRVCGEK